MNILMIVRYHINLKVLYIQKNKLVNALDDTIFKIIATKKNFIELGIIQPLQWGSKERRGAVIIHLRTS